MPVADKIVEVISICLPALVLILAGFLFRRKKIIDDGAVRFINFFTYNFSMPAIIFLSIIGGEREILFDHRPAFIVLAIPPIFALLYYVIGKALALPRNMMPAFIFSTFWSNITYLGYPLAGYSFGEEGVQYASLINGVGVPVQIILGFLLIARFSAEKIRFADALRLAILNPIVISIIAAYAIVLLTGPIDTAKPAHLPIPLKIIFEILSITGKTGFPLALIMIGAMLKTQGYRQYLKLGIWVSAGKLLLAPITAFLLLSLLGIGDYEARGSMILLMGMPSAVTGFVAALKYDAAPELCASLLVATTIFSLITIPLVLYLILSMNPVI